MKIKTNILDIYKGNDGKYSWRSIWASVALLTFCVCGVLDASVKGVDVNEGFYWACVTVVLGLTSVKALEQIAAIRTGQASIEQNKNNFDQQINNLEQGQNNASNAL